jgi:hypothetical protein
MDAIADATKVKRLTHRETLLIVLGMLLPIFMGSLDQTSLASAPCRRSGATWAMPTTCPG